MNTIEREQLRLSLLRFLLPTAALSRFGSGAALLLQQAKSEGRQGLAVIDVIAELEYLHEKGLVQPVMKTLSPENQMWKISAAGRDFAAQGGLE
jgi:hypothetical protein